MLEKQRRQDTVAFRFARCFYRANTTAFVNLSLDIIHIPLLGTPQYVPFLDRPVAHSDHNLLLNLKSYRTGQEHGYGAHSLSCGVRRCTCNRSGTRSAAVVATASATGDTLSHPSCFPKLYCHLSRPLWAA